MLDNYAFKGKNGQIKFFRNQEVEIWRDGWFGTLYQFVLRQQTRFPLCQITDVELVPPTWVRGYLQINGQNGEHARIWLTNKKMLEEALAILKRIESLRNPIKKHQE